MGAEERNFSNYSTFLALPLTTSYQTLSAAVAAALTAESRTIGGGLKLKQVEFLAGPSDDVIIKPTASGATVEVTHGASSTANLPLHGIDVGEHYQVKSDSSIGAVAIVSWGA